MLILSDLSFFTYSKNISNLYDNSNFNKTNFIDIIKNKYNIEFIFFINQELN